MRKALLVGPNLRKIVGLSCVIAETFKGDLLYIGILDRDQSVLFDFLVDCLTLDIVDTDAQIIPFGVNC